MPIGTSLSPARRASNWPRSKSVELAGSGLFVCAGIISLRSSRVHLLLAKTIIENAERARALLQKPDGKGRTFGERERLFAAIA